MGIRHVARQTSFVLIAPQWCKPLFDISQFASIRFPLPNGEVPDADAKVIRDRLVAQVPAVKESRTPYYELIGASQADAARRGAFQNFAERLSAFQASVKAVRLETDPARRKNRLAALRGDLAPAALEIPCSSNLPLLLRARGDEDDAERAGIIDHFVIAACERARQRNEGDEWLRPTLLGAAFRAGDAKHAAELAKSVKLEGPVRWKLSSTLADLAERIRQTVDPEKQRTLQEIYDALTRLVS